MITQLASWWRGKSATLPKIDDSLWGEVEAPYGFLQRLTPGERSELRQLALAFIAEKEWSGAQGLEVSLHMQLAIALQACLPILKLGLDWYAGWVGIVVYPGDFVIPRQVMDEDGVMHEYDDPVMGEAWHGGPVLLSWFDDPLDTEGVNVVIHEFAHTLDMKSGDADGLPPLPADMSRKHWIAVMQAAFEDFQRRVDAGEDTAIDPYAAEAPAEFFAVTSEVFFEDPQLLSGEYPGVYELLRQFYGQDPCAGGRPASS